MFYYILCLSLLAFTCLPWPAPALTAAALQFSSVLWWWGSSRPQGLCIDISLITLPQFLAFLALLALGQALNVGIFHAIGHVGVYYGVCPHQPS